MPSGASFILANIIGTNGPEYVKLRLKSIKKYGSKNC